MTAPGYKALLFSGSFLLLVSVVAAVALGQPLLCFVPLLALGGFYLLQHPEALYYTLLFSIPWSIEFNVTESLGTDLPDEPLMLLLAFAAAALYFSNRKRPVAPSLIGLLLLSGFAWSAITVIVSTNMQTSLKYLLAKGWYLLAFAAAPVWLGGGEKLIKRSAVVLVSSMLIATGVALLRHAFYGFSFSRVNDSLSPFFRNHVNYSALLVFMVPVLLAFYRLAPNRGQRVAVRALLLVVFSALLLSYARGAWLALLAGLLSYQLIKRGWLVKAFFGCLLVIAGLAFWLRSADNYLLLAPQHDTTIFHENFGEHLVATYRGRDVSTAERLYRWAAGARMAGEEWLTGFGPSTFNQQYKSYTVPAFRTWVSGNKEQSTVHNYYLLLLIEQGVTGLLFFLLLIGTMFWKAQCIYRRTNSLFWKTVVAAIASILWMQCTVNFLSDLIETDKVGSVFYLCTAFLLLADANTKSGEPPATNTA